MVPDRPRAGDLFPAGFLPLPHPNQDEGGMVLPKSSIDEIKKQTGRDLQRFDLDFDIPEHFLAEFPPAIAQMIPSVLDSKGRGRPPRTARPL